ncbi:MAG TPA: type IV secretory system conjugative DNA transfer family protein, partial [Solirubrobacteraceae bacterium]
MTRGRDEGLSDVAMLALIGCAVLTCGTVWLWGGLAGALFGRGWPAAGTAKLPSVLIRLPAHLANPAGAWPAPARFELPGPAAFYLTLVILIAAAVGLTLGARRFAALLSLRRGAAGARWASGTELRALRQGELGGRSRPPAAGRLVLGKRGGRCLFTEHRHALVAFGPPQSGKSAGLAVPALLEWPGPAVASSIKTDLLSVTLVRRRALGPVFVFDPFNLTGGASHTWSPLHGASTWDGALEVAWRLAAAGDLDQRGVEGGDFWAVAAEQRLAPLLYTASRSGEGITALVRWTYGQGSRELDQALARLAGEAQTES